MAGSFLPSNSGKPVIFNFSYRFVWGLASLGLNIIGGVYGALLPIFYQDYLGLSARWIGLASLLYAVWNAINDPLFGYITDSTRSKRGRRIPYMRYTAPFLALTFILVWFVPPQAGQQGLFWWMLLSMLLYDTCYTIIGLVYSALLPEVSESDSERNKLQISSSLFGLVGTLLGFIIPDFFRPQSGGDVAFLPLQIAMVILAVTGALMIIATTLKVKERPEFSQVDKPLPLGKAIQQTFSSKAFLILVAANFMSILVSALVTGTVFYLGDYVLQMDTIILLAFVFIPLLAGVPITDLLRRRFGVAGAQQLLLIVAGVGLLLIMIVPTPLILFCLALAGFGLSGPQTLTNVLFAQVADEDEVHTGVRREGAFFGVNALLTKPAQSIALALTPFILEMTHFVTREQNNGEIFLDQPANAITGIKIIVGLIPGIAMLIGAAILRFYPLKGDYLTEIQAKVLLMHSQKTEELKKKE